MVKEVRINRFLKRDLFQTPYNIHYIPDFAYKGYLFSYLYKTCQFHYQLQNLHETSKIMDYYESTLPNKNEVHLMF